MRSAPVYRDPPFLIDRARLRVPDLGGILRNRTIAREATGRREVQDHLMGPAFRIRIDVEEAPIRGEIGLKIGEMHIVIAAGEQGLAQGPEDARLGGAEMVLEDEVERRARLRL